ncbi:P22 phage major capsid protein family protein [Demequina rhizosphaerae]|uniref:P22 phage major capsid protein family protein n=1 Tax=Demequina rhizosphaerae TaxID=1638985 RepID=UPI00078681AE|nr:P22 phage major capsid protein family protein [Demequina rhizosphaerae]
MSNTLLDPRDLAGVTADLAKADFGLAGLVYTEASIGFAPGQGSTVNIAVPGSTSASERALGVTTDYTVDGVVEQTFPISVDAEAYSTVSLSLSESTLDLENYTRQILAPQARAVAGKIEGKVAALIDGMATEASITYDSANPKAALVKARAMLRANQVPGEIVVVAGSTAYADLLLSGDDVDTSAAVPKVAGMTIVENNRVAPTALVVMVRAAIGLAIVAPEPLDETNSAAHRTADGGFAVRVLRGTNPANGQSLSTVSTFVGAALLPIPKHDAETGETVLTDGIGAVAINTTGA